MNPNTEPRKTLAPSVPREIDRNVTNSRLGEGRRIERDRDRDRSKVHFWPYLIVQILTQAAARLEQPSPRNQRS